MVRAIACICWVVHARLRGGRILISIVPQLVRRCEMIADFSRRVFGLFGYVGGVTTTEFGNPLPILRRLWMAQFWLLLPLAFACSRQVEEGEQPPEPPPVRLQICSKVAQGLQEGLVTRAGGFCIDPDSDVRRYGTGADAALDAVCVELVNGECELYKSYGLEGVKTLQYVSDAGDRRTVNVIVSSFRFTAGAFGFFTRRILGDGRPNQITVKDLTVQGRAVEGIGMTMLWRGKQVVELTYVSEDETPAEVEKRSPAVLRPLTEAIGRELVGGVSPPGEVELLESLAPDRLGVLGLSDGFLGKTGTGEVWLAFFTEATSPHRAIVAERRGEDEAKDLLKLLRRSHVSKKLKGRDIYRIRSTAAGASPETWFFLRRGRRILGVGPLETVDAPRQSTPEERKGARLVWERAAVKTLLGLAAQDRKLAATTKK